jgi:asparagine synthase (glutamine-hydrolysing)
MPFFDNDLMEYTMAIPESLRKNSYIYNKMLLKVFPSYFSDIEWQKTGYPIGASKSNVFFHKAKRRLTYELSMGLSKVGISLPNNRNYTDYPNWIRLDPAKGFFIKVLLSPDNLYQRYISKENVHACLNEHLTKGKDYSNFLCRSLTFEIWLQQVYNKKYRQGTVDEKKDLI